MKKATTKIVVANFILPLILQTLAFFFCFYFKNSSTVQALRHSM